MKAFKSIAAFLAVFPFLLAACGSTIPASTYLNPAFDFSFVEKVAVIPFDNLSSDVKAGDRAGSLFVTEMLATGAVDVVEPGEVIAAMNKHRVRGAAVTKEQAVALGKDLGVQALILGNVTQAEKVRTGGASASVITLDVRMVETETGSAVWATTHTQKASGLAPQFLGTGGQPSSETLRLCVQKVIDTLIR